MQHTYSIFSYRMLRYIFVRISFIVFLPVSQYGILHLPPAYQVQVNTKAFFFLLYNTQTKTTKNERQTSRQKGRSGQVGRKAD